MSNVILIIWSLIVLNRSDQSGQWELQSDKDGIKIYRQEVEGSSINAFKAITTMESKPEDVLQILLNFTEYPQWVDRCQNVELLNFEKPNIYYIHSEINTPFPASNRDIVQKFSVDTIPDGFNIRVLSIPTYIEEKSGFVRMKSEGGWLIRQEGENSTYVEMQFHNDPLGNIPDWVINSLIVKTPSKTIQGLKNFAESK